MLKNRVMTSITFEPENLKQLRELAKKRGMSLGAFLETSILEEKVSPFEAEVFPPEHFSKRNSAIFMLANMDTPAFTSAELAELFGLSEQMVHLIKHGKGQKTGAEENAEAPFIEGITAPLSVTIPLVKFNEMGLSGRQENEFLNLFKVKLHEVGFASVSHVRFDTTKQLTCKLRKEAVSPDFAERIQEAVEWALNKADAEFCSDLFQTEGAE